MKGLNPYESAESDAESISPELLKKVADRLLAARERPPRVVHLVVDRRGLPRQLLIGVLGVICLSGIARLSGDFTPQPVIVAWLGFVVGATVRDFGIMVRAVRTWPAQEKMLDWSLVRQFAGVHDDSSTESDAFGR